MPQPAKPSAPPSQPILEDSSNVFPNKNSVPGNDYTGHTGIDLVANEGTSINAITGGVVVTFVNSYPNEYNWHDEGGLDFDPEIEDANKAYANRVQILGDDGKYYLYAHNQQSDLSLTVGQRVETGAVIGYVGNTGNSHGFHLHLEIRETSVYDSNIPPEEMWDYLP